MSTRRQKMPKFPCCFDYQQNTCFGKTTGVTAAGLSFNIASRSMPVRVPRSRRSLSSPAAACWFAWKFRADSRKGPGHDRILSTYLFLLQSA